MFGEIIKWRIKIVKKANGIGLGIGTKSILMNNNFIIHDPHYSKHGCYLIRASGYAFTYLDEQFNDRTI